MSQASGLNSRATFGAFCFPNVGQGRYKVVYALTSLHITMPFLGNLICRLCGVAFSLLLVLVSCDVDHNADGRRLCKSSPCDPHRMYVISSLTNFVTVTRLSNPKNKVTKTRQTLTKKQRHSRLRTSTHKASRRHRPLNQTISSNS